VLTLGALTRVELEGLADVTGQHFDVELHAANPLVAQLAAGQTVRLQPRQVRVFAQPETAGAA
jgi:sulfate transport system ATP-binding protein